ncbi:hypothetical protein [Gluconobacter oxydans]|uniref:Uncharacterized protein n=1 Tax=Gluconobacter oxydans NBRC 3293 TaxID=1315969 RepID=A0A829WGU8_GLUOY|nr:hypothetical protein [Gluconobacter oxydans]GEM16038.1 hypothetical protein NBRC3293_0535 [Gluconobacter oxydans NBRC 3293]
MGVAADRRRRQIRHKGRMMTISRVSGEPVALIAYSAPPATAALEAGVSVMPFVAETLNDELAAAGYGRPANADILTDGGRQYALTDAAPVYDGSELCGWKLIAAGGT